MRRTIEEWRQEPLKIAVIGQSRVGKSTFINTMRGISRSHPDAAKTNSMEECTMEVKAYLDPKNTNLVYYDLPGIGTINFPRDTYVEKIPLDSYDFIIILSRDCFTENEYYLAKELDRLEKKFYFVRTRIDQNIEDEVSNGDDCFNELSDVDKTREVCEKSVKNFFGVKRVFAISGQLKNYLKWDFPKLIHALMEDATGIKQEVIIRTITASSHEAVDMKVALLGQCIFMVALASAGIVALPIPGLPIACDVALITREIHQYMIDFGLDENSMENLAKTCSMNRADLEESIFGASTVLKGNSISAINSVVVAILSKNVAVSVVGRWAQFTVGIGQVISSGISFVTVMFALESPLREIKLLAYKRAEQLRILAK